jgi:DNA-binding beta-propeller fold protein YncE
MVLHVVGAQVAVTTLAGSGSATFADGTGAGASFYSPKDVALDSSGNVIVADASNHRIRKVTPGGVVSTLAGSGSGTFADGTGAGASFNGPSGVAVDSSGNVIVVDRNNHRIRKVTPGGRRDAAGGARRLHARDAASSREESPVLCAVAAAPAVDTSRGGAHIQPFAQCKATWRAGGSRLDARAR